MPCPIAVYDATVRRNHLAFLRTIFPDTPLTPEEAEQAYNDAPSIPLSPERIAAMVAYAVRGSVPSGT